MDGQRARLRINLSQREFEVEGNEAFVQAYAERFDALLGQLTRDGKPAPEPATPAQPPDGGTQAGPVESFGQLLHFLPRGASDVDRILLAGYFVQLRSPEHGFTTGDANSLLTEQGIKVGNPSQCVRQNLLAKRVFKHQKRYRVAQVGTDHLRHLLGAALPG